MAKTGRHRPISPEAIAAMSAIARKTIVDQAVIFKDKGMESMIILAGVASEIAKDHIEIAGGMDVLDADEKPVNSLKSSIDALQSGKFNNGLSGDVMAIRLAGLKTHKNEIIKLVITGLEAILPGMEAAQEKARQPEIRRR